MILFLFSVIIIITEMAFFLMLGFKNPFRELVLEGLDRFKRGMGPVVLKTVAGTVFVVFMSSIYSLVKLRNRWITDEVLNSTDQVLLAKHKLVATLMGSCLFFGLMMDRLHHFIRELPVLKKNMEVAEKRSRIFKDKKVEEGKALKQEMTTLQAKLLQLKSELEEKTKQVSSLKATVIALRKQSEGFLRECDRLIEENQSLRKQLRPLDLRLSRSSGKKNA